MDKMTADVELVFEGNSSLQAPLEHTNGGLYFTS